MFYYEQKQRNGESSESVSTAALPSSQHIELMQILVNWLLSIRYFMLVPVVTASEKEALQMHLVEDLFSSGAAFQGVEESNLANAAIAVLCSLIQTCLTPYLLHRHRETC